MAYVDGFLVAVPTANKEAYLKIAEETAPVFKKYGALSVVECWGDDVPEGKVNSMHTAVMRKPDESVVFSWVVWPSRAVRDEAWPKMMDDPAMAEMTMPFDGQRMIHGGFEPILGDPAG